MSGVQIIRNQDGHYWGRGKRWVDGRDLSKVAHFGHLDEAINTVFELSLKDPSLRCEYLSVDLTDGKLPKLAISDTPLPDLQESQDQRTAQIRSQNTLENSENATMS